MSAQVISPSSLAGAPVLGRVSAPTAQPPVPKQPQQALPSPGKQPAPLPATPSTPAKVTPSKPQTQSPAAARFVPLPKPKKNLVDKHVIVAVRCRPLNAEEAEKQASISVRVRADPQQETATRLFLTEPAPSYQEIPFAFDMCYQNTNVQETGNVEDDLEVARHHASQEQQLIINEIGALVIDAIWKGQGITVLTNGASRTGKTYTLFGNERELGVMPRVMQDLLYRIEEHKKKEQIENREKNANKSVNTEFVVEFSAVEVYLEKVRDLMSSIDLDDDDDNPQEISRLVGSAELKIRNHPSGGSYIPTLTRTRIGSVAELTVALESADRTAHLDIRKANLDTKGHMIAMLRLTVTETVKRKDENGVESEKKETRSTTAVFADLAHQEAPLLEKHQPKYHLREIHTKNRGLLSVANCLRVVNDKQLGSPKHRMEVRSSALTRLLFDSQKFILINCIGPADLDFPESFQTLAYAQRCYSDRVDRRGIKPEPIPDAVLLSAIEELEILVHAEHKKANSAEEELLKLKQVHTEQLGALRNEVHDEIARNSNVSKLEDENAMLRNLCAKQAAELERIHTQHTQNTLSDTHADLLAEIERIKHKIAKRKAELAASSGRQRQSGSNARSGTASGGRPASAHHRPSTATSSSSSSPSHRPSTASSRGKK